MDNIMYRIYFFNDYFIRLKVELPMKRAEYVVGIWRLVLVLEYYIQENLQVRLVYRN